MSHISNIIDSISWEKGASSPPIDFFQLFTTLENKNPLIHLDEALEKGQLEITEVSEGGSVPNLRATNRSAQDILILDGDELRGAKQNRIVDVTIIIPAFTTIIIPVSCVEQGRWRRTSSKFEASGNFMYSSLRSMKVRAVTANLRSGRGARSDQGMIWSEIADKQARMSVGSPTGAMSDLYRAHCSEMPETEVKEGQVGLGAFVAGGFAGCDVVFDPGMFRRKSRKLASGYWLESKDRSLKFPTLTFAMILEELRTAREERFETVGKGEEVRFESRNLHGYVKMLGESPVCLSIFPKMEGMVPRHRRGIF